MDLLTDGLRALWRSKINDTIDTFAKQDIILISANVSYFDRLGEDNDNASVQIPLKCFTEYQLEDDDIEAMRNFQGTIDDAEVKVNLGYDDLLAINVTPPLIDSDGKAAIFPETDFMLLRGESYRVLGVGLDGPIGSTEVLVAVFIKKEQRVTQATNNV